MIEASEKKLISGSKVVDCQQPLPNSVVEGLSVTRPPCLPRLDVHGDAYRVGIADLCSGPQLSPWNPHSFGFSTETGSGELVSATVVEKEQMDEEQRP